MKISRWAWPLLIGPVAVLAAEPARPGPNEQQVIAAMLRLADAIDAGDASAMAKLVAVDENSIAQRDGRDLITGLVAAQKRLERAAQQRFGAGAARFAWGYAALAPVEHRKKLEQSRVALFQGGAQATVICEGDCRLFYARRGGQGQWQIVLEAISDELSDEFHQDTQKYGPDYLSSVRLARYRQTLEAVNQTIQRVEGGQYTTAAQAEAALIAGVDAAWAEQRIGEMMERRRRFRR